MVRFAHQRKLLCKHIANHAINLVPSESKCLAVRMMDTGRQSQKDKELEETSYLGSSRADHHGTPRSVTVLHARQADSVAP